MKYKIFASFTFLLASPLRGSLPSNPTKIFQDLRSAKTTINLVSNPYFQALRSHLDSTQKPTHSYWKTNNDIMAAKLNPCRDLIPYNTPKSIIYNVNFRFNGLIREYNKLTHHDHHLRLQKKYLNNPVSLKKISSSFISLKESTNRQEINKFEDMLKKTEPKLDKEIETNMWNLNAFKLSIYKFIKKYNISLAKNSAFTDIYKKGKNINKYLKENIDLHDEPSYFLIIAHDSANFVQQNPNDYEGISASRAYVKRKIFNYLHKAYSPEKSLMYEAHNLFLTGRSINDQSLQKDAITFMHAAYLLGETTMLPLETLNS